MHNPTAHPVERQAVVMLEVLHRFKEGQLSSHELANYIIACANNMKRYHNRLIDNEALAEVLEVLIAKPKPRLELVV